MGLRGEAPASSALIPVAKGLAPVPRGRAACCTGELVFPAEDGPMTPPTSASRACCGERVAGSSARSGQMSLGETDPQQQSEWRCGPLGGADDSPTARTALPSIGLRRRRRDPCASSSAPHRAAKPPLCCDLGCDPEQPEEENGRPASRPTSRSHWSGRQDLNLRPPAPKATLSRLHGAALIARGRKPLISLHLAERRLRPKSHWSHRKRAV
jgi:hypothetical protein